MALSSGKKIVLNDKFQKALALQESWVVERPRKRSKSFSVCTKDIYSFFDFLRIFLMNE